MENKVLPEKENHIAVVELDTIYDCLNAEDCELADSECEECTAAGMNIVSRDCVIEDNLELEEDEYVFITAPDPEDAE